MELRPYIDSPLPRKRQIALMFDRIALRYDFLNHLLSLNVDRFWRKRAVALLGDGPLGPILDVASGTGDFALAALKANPDSVTAIDISEKMLAIGRKKTKRRGLEHKIGFIYGDAEDLPFGDSSFDAVISAFGVRNFEDTSLGLREMYRVLRPGGKVVILEFSRPVKGGFKQVYNLYFSTILPTLGRWFSGDHAAYSYLPGSVGAFPDGREFLTLLDQAGFLNSRAIPLTWGIASIYSGVKEEVAAQQLQSITQ